MSTHVPSSFLLLLEVLPWGLRKCSPENFEKLSVSDWLKMHSQATSVGLVRVSKETNSIFEDIWAQVHHFEKKWSFRVMKRFLRVKHEIASIVVMQ